MKKFRGKKRYYKNLHKLSKYNYTERFDYEWYNYQHTHVDFYGYGNLGFGHRREHVAALFTLFELAKSKITLPIYQLWVVIEKDDAGQDALYIHTPNPNSSFPCKLDVTIAKGRNQLLQFLKSFNYDIYENDYAYIIFDSNFGEALL